MDVKARKGWLEALVLLGLVAGLLGAGADRASGSHPDSEEPDNRAVYSACVGAALDSAGFEDAAGLRSEDAINCLAHYGVTQGRTAVSFAPRETVSRWQMALFMARAAGPAGIVLANPAEDQGFTDIGGLSESARNAVNGLAAAGIMPGVTDTSFAPNSAVTRASMAALLDAFLSNATPGPGAFNNEKYNDIASPNIGRIFTDIGGVAVGAHNAIGRIYEMGVSEGFGDHEFGPNRLVTRAQMASFITRALAHTVARPAGVSIQVDKVELGQQNANLVVSLRDASFQPLASRKVDAFSSTDPDGAFDGEGACATRGDGSPEAAGGGGPDTCEIDFGDLRTGASGDVTGLLIELKEASRTVWAWTGDVGAAFDNEETTAAMVSISYAKPAVKAILTDNLRDNQSMIRLDDSVTFTLQMSDEDDNPVAESGYKVNISVTTTGVDGGSSASGLIYTTDEDGKVELTFTQVGTSAPNETAKVTLGFGAVTGNSAPEGGWTVTDKATNKMISAGAMIPDPEDTNPADGQDMIADPDAGKFAARWSEAQAKASTLQLENTASFIMASDEGVGATSRLVATVTDQYGAGVRGAAIRFRSDDPHGLGALPLPSGETAGGAVALRLAGDCAVPSDKDDSKVLPDGHFDDCWTGEPRNNRRTTNSAGVARFSYDRDRAEGGVEMLWATYDNGLSGADAISLASERVYQYWAEEADRPVFGRIVEADPDNGQILINGYGGPLPLLVKYDRNDQLLSLEGPDMFSDFEKQLGRADDASPPTHVLVGSYASRADGVSKITLQRRSTTPSADIVDGMGYEVAVDASDGGVIVMGDRGANAVWVFDGPGDAEPQKLTEDGAGKFGYDAAISNDGSVIAVGDPGAEVDSVAGNGKVHVYTRSGDAYSRIAVLTDADAGPGQTGSSSAPRDFGSSVDVSGDGGVIVGLAAADTRTGDGKVFVKPSGGWVDDAEPDATVDCRDAVSGSRGVSISDDGTVIVCGATGSSSEAGGVLVAQAASTGWDTAALTATVLLEVSGDDVLTGARRLGNGVKVSGDGKVIAVPGADRISNSVDNQREVIYIFTQPDSGTWAAASTGYAKLTMDGLLSGTTVPVGSFPSEEGGGQHFAEWVDINTDGSEVITGRYLRPGNDLRGSLVLFKKAADANTYSVDREYIGDSPNRGFGRFGSFIGDGKIVGVDRFGGRITSLDR